MADELKPRARKRHLVAKAALLIASGKADEEVRNSLLEEDLVSRATAYRYVALAHLRHERRLETKRYQLVARQSAKLDLAQGLALKARKAIQWRDGDTVATRLQPAPDVGSFVSAVTAQNRLLGVNAPEEHRVLVANIRDVLGEVVSVVRDFLPDPEVRARFVGILRARVEGKLQAREAPLAQLGEGEIVEPGENGGPPPPPPPSGGNGKPGGNGEAGP